MQIRWTGINTSTLTDLLIAWYMQNLKQKHNFLPRLNEIKQNPLKGRPISGVIASPNTGKSTPTIYPG